MAALREVWGYPCTPGVINRSSDGTVATVEADGVPLARIELAASEPVEAELLRFDPVLNLRLLPSLEDGKRHDLVQLVQIDPDYTVRAARRGPGHVEFPTTVGSQWGILPVRNVISAAYCEMDTELPLARFVTPY